MYFTYTMHKLYHDTRVLTVTETSVQRTTSSRHVYLLTDAEISVITITIVDGSTRVIVV
mgnify:FL=1